VSLRIATAPISWGVSEVDGWGVQLSPERVLAEMRSLGFEATELGAQGFLPPAPEDKAARLAEFGMTAIGSFVPVIAHQPGTDPLPRIEQELRDYAASGAMVLVVCADSEQTGYDAQREPLTDEQWSTLFTNLDRITAAAAAVGVTATLHPHVGTVVETKDDVDAVLAGSTIPFCFDTGHLFLGGTDPVRFAAEHSDRIAYMHLKDVSLEGMRRVADGEISYTDAITADVLYRPVGQGDVDIRAILQSVVDAGFDGWIVLEQDKVVLEEPAPGEGPIADARASVEFVRGLVAELESARSGGAR
jgi:inosose dehydratase